MQDSPDAEGMDELLKQLAKIYWDIPIIEEKKSWKPSEEQLNALNFAITYFMHETNYKNPTGLRDLYDDLLKLK